MNPAAQMAMEFGRGASERMNQRYDQALAANPNLSGMGSVGGGTSTEDIPPEMLEFVAGNMPMIQQLMGGGGAGMAGGSAAMGAMGGAGGKAAMGAGAGGGAALSGVAAAAPFSDEGLKKVTYADDDELEGLVPQRRSY